MAGYKIQLKDKNGNLQYPVSTTNVVVDADGVSVADLLDRKQPTLVSGVNIKTINGKTLLGEGDLVIEGGTADLSGYATEEYVDAKVGESYPIYYSYDGTPLTEEQKAANKMAVDRYAETENVALYPYMSSAVHRFDVMLTLSEGAWKTAELTKCFYIYFNDDGTTMHYVKVTVEQDGDVQVEFSAQSPLVLASKAYVDSKVGGGSEGGSDSSNVVSFYMPLMDDSVEVVTYEDCINEITTRFADSISQEVIDAITSHFQSMIDHNVASFAELEERLRNGEKPLIVMRGFTYWLFVLMLYLWAVAEGGGMDVTDEELIAELNTLAHVYEVIYPESYMMDFYEDSGAALEVTAEGIGVSIGANGNWEKQSETDVRKTATLYYEGAARLTAKECETNLKSKGYWLNNCDFQVSRTNGTGWSDVEDVLIIGKTTKTVTDFVNLNGDVVTCGVTAFQYIEDTQLIELQVSNEDGYCRRVVLGKVVASGSSDGGGLKYFVERYVYEGKTEEERTYNLESLAMLEEGADILWAGLGGPQPNYEGAMWHERYEIGYFAYNAIAEINAETGVLEMHSATFVRDFYLGNVYKEYVKAFFAEEQCIYERAFYQGQPIISWFEETNKTVRAYFIANGLIYSYVLINIETGEVSEPVIVQ